MNPLSSLPPPPKGQTGVTLDQFSHLPPPPTGQQGMTLDQIQNTPPASPDAVVTNKGAFGNFVSNIGIAGKQVFNALTGSEQSAGQDAAAAIGGGTAISQASQLQQQSAASDVAFVKAMKARQSSGQSLTTGQQQIYDTILNGHSQPSAFDTAAQSFPALNKTNGQVLGDIGGVAADALTAGSYSKAGLVGDKALTTGLTKAAPVAEQVGKQTLGQIGKQTAVRSATGAGVGYGYDVAGNLQQGKTGGDALMPGAATVAGATIPALIGGVRAGVAISREQAPRFINSLIKPKTADFAYGKDPGRTVSELGITGNSLPDFEKNITAAKNDVIGGQIGAIYDLPANANAKINATPALSRIDAAINDAAKGGRNNQGIVTQLNNIKDALLYEHAVNNDGLITKAGDTPRDLTALSPKEAQQLIQHVADQTQFTGRPSDDKAVNSTLKSVYGSIRDLINNAVAPNNPEILKLNQQYGDLTSAELAIRNRAAIVQRSNLTSPIAFSKPIGAAGTAATLALLSGAATVPATIIAIGAAGIEKAMETTAVKSRVAAWLGKQTPGALSTFFAAHPNIAPVLTRAFPAILGKMNSPTNTNQ